MRRVFSPVRWSFNGSSPLLPPVALLRFPGFAAGSEPCGLSPAQGPRVVPGLPCHQAALFPSILSIRLPGTQTPPLPATGSPFSPPRLSPRGLPATYTPRPGRSAVGCISIACSSFHIQTSLSRGSHMALNLSGSWAVPASSSSCWPCAKSMLLCSEEGLGSSSLYPCQSGRVFLSL